MAEVAVAAANSFSIDGEVELDFFPGREDAYRVMVNGERVEEIMARMLGFPSEVEFDAALASGFSPDPDQPSITRKMGSISLSVYRNE